MNRFLQYCLGGLLAVFLVLPHAHAGQGPLEAIATAQKAIDGSDATLFNKVVDVDSILDKGLVSALEILNQRMREGKLSNVNPVLALMLSGMAQDPAKVELVRVLLGTEIKKFVTAGINGGYFAGKPNGKVGGGAFPSLLHGLSKDRKELVPGKVLSREGNTATLSATLVDHGAGAFPLELGLTREGELWRVTEIVNVHALLDGALK